MRGFRRRIDIPIVRYGISERATTALFSRREKREGIKDGGIIAGAVVVIAGGGFCIVADGWPEAVLVALAVASTFRLGSWIEYDRVTALSAVVRPFYEKAAVQLPRSRRRPNRRG